VLLASGTLSGVIAGVAPAQDNGQPVPAAPAAAGDGDALRLEAFAEPVQLRVLIDLISSYLGIEVILRGEVEGEVGFANPRVVPRGAALGLLESLLDLNDYALTFDAPSGFYVVQRSADVRMSFDGEFATTRVIGTPNIRPSALQPAVQSLLQRAGTGGAPGGGGEGIAYVDELGVIIVSGSPRRVRYVQDVVSKLLAEQAQMENIRVPLRYVAAPVARQRAIELVGAAPRAGAVTQAQPGRGQAAMQDPGRIGGGETFDNLGDRLRLDPQGNALIFRGRPAEIDQVRRVLELIDQPSQLLNKQYSVGRAARQVADIARQRGLGEVVVMQSTEQQQQQIMTQRMFDPTGRNPLQGAEGEVAGGSSMVVNVETGTVVYYATPEQHEELSRLIRELDIERDAVVTRTYKLAHAGAEEVTEIILALIEETAQTGNQGMLPGGFSPFGGATGVFFDPSLEGSVEGELGSLRAGRDTRVVADPANNQILVRARLRQQEEFARLIERLDLRRPQVYVEATIISVTNNQDFRLAIETQLINAGGSGGALQTNFGLSEAGDSFTDPRSPLRSLGGLTTAFIQSQYLPLVINAIQTDTDARIVATPSLLVDDNSEAEIVSLDQQPTTTTSQDGTSTQTGFGGFEDAGTRLTVRPRISDGGYLQLDYAIELSNFIGQGSSGIPAPRQERNIRAESVTVPGDTTIVVGGIKINDLRETVVKVPLLGDIPILGHLFRDTREVQSEAVLYVFIRPRIMRDDTFRDLRLMTEGPQAAVALPADLPPILPRSVEVIRTRGASGGTGGRAEVETPTADRGAGVDEPGASVPAGERSPSGLRPGEVRRLSPPPEPEVDLVDEPSADGTRGG